MTNGNWQQTKMSQDQLSQRIQHNLDILKLGVSWSINGLITPESGLNHTLNSLSSTAVQAPRHSQDGSFERTDYWVLSSAAKMMTVRTGSREHRFIKKCKSMRQEMVSQSEFMVTTKADTLELQMGTRSGMPRVGGKWFMEETVFMR